ncbi:MAG TPA: hypothetical protein EYP68_06345 [Candidatus Korarchaeota archaeon]|nr:hypothetical protein [Candidatus Korarchaeota archaeon]
MFKKVLKIISFLLGAFLSVGGLALILYDIYWLMSREGSILGVGFALLSIVFGFVLLIIGTIILRRTIK